MSKIPRIEVRNLTKSFRRAGGDLIRPVDNITLTVTEDEMVVLLGPSGCGKTTLLRCVAGLERPDTGEIVIDGQVVFSSEKGILLPPEKRGISMIFQSYALWPHMSVFENVAYPLRSQKSSENEIKTRVNRVLEATGVGNLGAQHPGRISGGQQQRVALARALVSGSSVVLFDEPLSNVDTQVRAKLRLELRRLHREIKFSALYVTHDQTEALELGSRVAILDRGTIADLGPPRRVYEAPANEYVANFVGVANLVPASISAVTEDSITIQCALGDFAVTRSNQPAQWKVGDKAIAVIRPEQLRFAKSPDALKANGIAGQVDTIMFAGPHIELVLMAGDVLLRVWANPEDVAALEEGSVVQLSVLPDMIHLVVPGSAGAIS